MSRGALSRIALLALIWGSGFLWIKLADREFSPAEVTFTRLALGAMVLFSVMLVRRDRVPRSLRLWALIAAAALFGNAVPYLLFATAEQTVASSTAGIVAATTPLWTVILALTVRHQKSLAKRQAAGLAVGFAGAVLIFSPWRTASELVSVGGLECLTAAASYAVSYVYMDRFLARRGVGTIVLPACQLAAAAVMLAIALGITGARPPQLTAQGIAAVAVLGIIGTGLAYVLNYQIIASEGATVASTVTYLVPVTAIVLGVLVLSETITVNMIAGIALVLAGIALTRRQPAPAKKATNLATNQTNQCLASLEGPDTGGGSLGGARVRMGDTERFRATVGMPGQLDDRFGGGHGDLPLHQVQVASPGVTRIVADPGQLSRPDAGGRQHRQNRRVAALSGRAGACHVRLADRRAGREAGGERGERGV